MGEEVFEDLDFSEGIRLMGEKKKAELLEQTSAKQDPAQESMGANAKRGRPRSEAAKERRTYYVEIELADELSKFVGKAKTFRDKAGKRISISESEVVSEGIRIALKGYRKKYKIID